MTNWEKLCLHLPQLFISTGWEFLFPKGSMPPWGSIKVPLYLKILLSPKNFELVMLSNKQREKSPSWWGLLTLSVGEGRATVKKRMGKNILCYPSDALGYLLVYPCVILNSKWTSVLAMGIKFWVTLPDKLFVQCL